jgi:biotin carboxylase
LRREFGLTNGQDTESALRFRDKVLMKQRLQEHKISVPTFAAVDCVSDVISFINQYGYPVVVKPRKGYSSIGTTAIRTSEKLATWLAIAFKSGTLHTFLCDCNSHFVAMNSTK